MRNLVMQTTGSSGLFAVPGEPYGADPDRPVVWLALSGWRARTALQLPWARQAQSRLDATRLRLAVRPLGCLVGALVHAAIVLTHWGDERVTAGLFRRIRRHRNPAGA
jgi:hypothetical protein